MLASDDRVVGEVPLKEFEKQYCTHVLWGKEVHSHRAKLCLSNACVGFFLLAGKPVEVEVDENVLKQGDKREDVMVLYQWSPAEGPSFRLANIFTAFIERFSSADRELTKIEKAQQELDGLSTDLDTLLDEC